MVRCSDQFTFWLGWVKMTHSFWNNESNFKIVSQIYQNLYIHWYENPKFFIHVIFILKAVYPNTLNNAILSYNMVCNIFRCRTNDRSLIKLFLWQKPDLDFAEDENLWKWFNPSLAEHDMPCLRKQCRSRSIGFWRSQMIWISTVCH